MYWKHENRINELMALGIRDLEQNGLISNRQITLRKDGSSSMFPPAETNGVSLNLHCDSARIRHKMLQHYMVKQNKISGFLFLHGRIFLDPPGPEILETINLYVLVMDSEGTIFVDEEYTVNKAGKFALARRNVVDEDPEASHWIYATVAENLISMNDEQFAAVPKEKWAVDMPQEWIDYIYHERENRDEGEWYSPDPVPELPETVTEQGGHDEVLDAEETV